MLFSVTFVHLVVNLLYIFIIHLDPFGIAFQRNNITTLSKSALNIQFSKLSDDKTILLLTQIKIRENQFNQCNPCSILFVLNTKYMLFYVTFVPLVVNALALIQHSAFIIHNSARCFRHSIP